MKYGFMILLLWPLRSSAATEGSLQAFLGAIGGFFNGYLIPLMMALAFLFFVINAVRFFIFAGDTEDGRKNARTLTIYSLGAFVLILTFWGIVNMVTKSIFSEFDNNPDCHFTISDYVMRPTDDCHEEPFPIGPQ